mgnify:CR=1 FL=1
MKPTALARILGALESGSGLAIEHFSARGGSALKIAARGSLPRCGYQPRQDGDQVCCRIISRAACTNYRPLGDEESLLLIILDDLGRANFRFVRVKPDVTKSASLAQEVPALIQFDLDLCKPLTIDCPLLVQSVFLCSQVLNVFEDGLILGVILHNSFLPCEWDGDVHGLRFDVTPTPNLGQPMC